jgi:hypothetical protein
MLHPFAALKHEAQWTIVLYGGLEIVFGDQPIALDCAQTADDHDFALAKA